MIDTPLRRHPVPLPAARVALKSASYSSSDSVSRTQAASDSGSRATRFFPGERRGGVDSGVEVLQGSRPLILCHAVVEAFNDAASLCLLVRVFPGPFEAEAGVDEPGVREGEVGHAREGSLRCAHRPWTLRNATPSIAPFSGARHASSGRRSRRIAAPRHQLHVEHERVHGFAQGFLDAAVLLFRTGRAKMSFPVVERVEDEKPRIDTGRSIGCRDRASAWVWPLVSVWRLVSVWELG